MSGGKVRYFLTLILLLPVAAACTPVGTVFDSEDDSFSADEMWVTPLRDEYKAGEFFRPEEDLSVFISEQGTVKSVPVNRLSIGIITNPDAAIRDAPIPVPVSGAQLISAMGVGRKLVNVEYSGYAASYSIEVRDVIGGGGGGGTGEGSGFIVIWK